MRRLPVAADRAGTATSAEPLVDGFGRVATDLRVSVIDRCNFRCSYCMPAEGLPWLPKDELLTPEEIERLVALFLSLGVREVKLTGGEPTVRPELAEIVARIRALDRELADGERLDISITTNGLVLDRLAEPLREAGLDRVTISCDSMLRHRFAEMTRRDALERVQAGLAAADAAGFSPVKLNCVVIRGQNEDEVVDFARLARETGHEVRFIEYMPLDAERAWERAKVVPSAEIHESIAAEFLLEPIGGGPQPATVFGFADGAPGAVGFISSVTRPFCETCNRIRITADGQFRVCLFALEETDLRGPLRDGGTEERLERLIRGAVAAKWAGHKINHPDFERPSRSMSMIGG